MTRQLPLTSRALAAIAVVVVMVIGGYVGLIAPRRRATALLEAQLQAASRPPRLATLTPITDEERAGWERVRSRVRERFVPVTDQRRVVVEMVRLARTSGLQVTDVQLQSAPIVQADAPEGTAQPVTLPFAMPANVAVNPGIVRLTVQHRFDQLLAFLDRVPSGNSYAVLYGLDVRRVDGYLDSDIRLVSLGWIE